MIPSMYLILRKRNKHFENKLQLKKNKQPICLHAVKMIEQVTSGASDMREYFLFIIQTKTRKLP